MLVDRISILLFEINQSRRVLKFAKSHRSRRQQAGIAGIALLSLLAAALVGLGLFATYQFIDPAPKVYRLPSLNATLGDNNQTGWLELDLSAKRPVLKGELSSDKLDLRPIFQANEKKDVIEAKSVKPAVEKEKKSIAGIKLSGCNVYVC